MIAVGLFPMIFASTSVAFGLMLLFAGGEFIVRGAVGLAKPLRIAPAIVGITVVGFGTSLPELTVSLSAARLGHPDVALGNVIGSNIANILLILGLSALLWPLRPKSDAFTVDALVMVGATIALFPILMLGQITRASGVLLLVGLVAYLVARIATASSDQTEAQSPRPVWFSTTYTVGGLELLVVGARFLVDGAVDIALGFGVSEAVIGLTIVAVGTSLPELITSIVAALRRQPEIALGNILGSNIFNILGILGVTATISPITVTPQFLRADLPIAFASASVMVLLIRRQSIGRLSGVALLGCYAAYLTWLQ